jgi:2-phosphosulfolactate phosphatase
MLLGRVHLLPETVEPVRLPGGIAVVIDLLRATTTVCHALAAGAAEVRPCLEIDEARLLAANLGRERCLLGGERRGVRIEGFDCGNSPSEYTRERVAGKTLVFTTTNGTRAIGYVLEAEQVLLASLANLSAVCREIAKRPGSLDIVCAGTDAGVTREDVLVAGAIVDRLTAADVRAAWQWNDEALVARDAWRAIARDNDFSQALLAALRDSRGGRNLVELGYDADIVTAAEVDSLGVVPEVLRDEGGLRIVRQ